MIIKRWEKALLFGLILTIALSTVSFSATCGEIRQSVLRLHILANSDSAADQQLKLQVRDRLLQEGADLFDGFSTEAQAAEAARQSIDRLQDAAQDEIRARGYTYPVSIDVKKLYFNTRTYDNVTLPAGEYEAVQVCIGEAAGQNWWCVLFPPMCLPAASEQQELGNVLEPDAADIVTDAPKYEIQFWAVEAYESAKDFIKELF